MKFINKNNENVIIILLLNIKLQRLNQAFVFKHP